MSTRLAGEPHNGAGDPRHEGHAVLSAAVCGLPTRAASMALAVALASGCAAQGTWMPPPGRTQAQIVYDEQVCLQRAALLTGHDRRIGVVTGALTEELARRQYFAACAEALGYRIK